MKSVPNDPQQDGVEFVSHYANDDQPECVDALLAMARPAYTDEQKLALKRLAEVLAKVIRRQVDKKD